MTNTPVPAPHRHIPRSASLLLRWTACITIIAGVFFIARHQTATNATPESPTPSREVSIDPAPNQGDELFPEGFEDIVDQVLAPLEDLLNGQQTPGSDDDPLSSTAEPSGAAWRTHVGDGVNDTSWSVDLPREWTSTTMPNGRYVAGPDEQRLFFTLESYPTTMSFEDLVWSFAHDLPTRVLVNASQPSVIPNPSHPEGLAYEVSLDYDHPSGFRSHAAILIIDTGDAYYVATAEAPGEDPNAPTQIETILHSLTINARA